MYDAQQGGAAPGTVSVDGSTLTIDPADGFVGFFSVVVTVTDTGGSSDSALIRVDVTAAPAVATGVTQQDLEGEAEATPARAELLEISELGFADALEGTPSGSSDPVDAIFSDLNEGGDLLNDELADDLASDLLSD